MQSRWNNVKSEHIIKAIKLFELKQQKYPKARSTFLINDAKRYPAKHIRGIAYEIANKEKISKDDYSGGKETADFLRRLGFDIMYNSPEGDSIIQEKTKSRFGGSVVSQKNAIQRLLQKKLGIIETEKKYDWLKTPNINNLVAE